MNGFQAMAHLVDYFKSKREMVFAASKSFGDNIKVRVRFPELQSENTKPYVQMFKATNSGMDIFPVELSCEAMMADDWHVFDERGIILFD